MCDKLPYQLYGSQNSNVRGGKVVGFAKDEAGMIIENFLRPETYGLALSPSFTEEDALDFIFLCARYGFNTSKELDEALTGANLRRRQEAKIVEIISGRKGVSKEACEAYYHHVYVPNQTVEQWFGLFLKGKNPAIPKKGFKEPVPIEFIVYDEPCSLSVELIYNKRLTEIIKEQPNETVSELILNYEFGSLGIRPWSCYPKRTLKGYKGERSSREESVQGTSKH